MSRVYLVSGLGQNISAGLAIEKAQGSDNYLLSPTIPAHNTLAPGHILIQMSEVAKEIVQKEQLPARRPTASEAHKRKRATSNSTKGKCAYEHCAVVKPKEARHKCMQCKEGKGAFYHPQCFWLCHRATLM